MHSSAATFNDSAAISCALRFDFLFNARAALKAKFPPDPMATIPS